MRRRSLLKRFRPTLVGVVFWIFTLGTLAYVGTAGVNGVANLATPMAGTNTHYFQVSNPTSDWSAPGLTYQGLSGALLALIEAAAVAGGLVLLFLPRLKLRILGSAIVVGWTALWMAGAVAFAAKSGGAWPMAAAYAVPVGAALIYTMRRMRSAPKRGRGGLSPSLPANEPSPKAPRPGSPEWFKHYQEKRRQRETDEIVEVFPA